MDYSLLQVIHTFFTSYPLGSGIAIVCATYALFLLPFGLLFLGKKWKSALVLLCTSALLAYFVNVMVGLFYFRPRPFVDHPLTALIHKSAVDKSFPSDHTALAFAFAMALFYYNRRVGWIAFFIAACIGIGRVAVGVHYPSDVFAGMIVGIASAYVMHRIIFFQKSIVL